MEDLQRWAMEAMWAQRCFIIPVSERDEKEPEGMNGLIGCCVWVYFCVSEKSWLYVTLKKSNNAVDFVFLSPSQYRDPWVSGAFISRLYPCPLGKSPNISTLNFNTSLAPNGHCTGQGYSAPTEFILECNRMSAVVRRRRCYQISVTGCVAK